MVGTYIIQIKCNIVVVSEITDRNFVRCEVLVSTKSPKDVLDPKKKHTTNQERIHKNDTEDTKIVS